MKLNLRTVPSFCIPRALYSAVLLGLLLGCKPSGAENPSAEQYPKPTAEQLQQARHLGYNTPAGTRQECLGRLVFDVQRDLQWGVNAPGLRSGDRYRFTESMHGGHDDLWVGNTQVVVMAPATWAHVERMHRATNAEKNIGILEYQTMVETKRGRVADFQRLLDDPSKNTEGYDTSTYPAAIAEIKKDIADIETRIANIQKDWHPLDLGIPNSLGYAGGPNLYAFVLHEDRAYKFVSASGEGEPPFEVRQQAFLDMLRRFQFRKMYEVPKVPGICVPYGFIPDDGKLGFRVGVSMRYADRPGVIYTLGTGVVGERGVDGSEPSLLTAIARAGTVGMVPGRDAQRIGPRQARIGALSAEQGGASLNVADPGKPPVRSYSVYTGYGGWGHSRVLPYITVDMRSFTKEQERTLKADPPPFEESLERLDGLLQSIRLRPTEPLMPELAGSTP